MKKLLSTIAATLLFSSLAQATPQSAYRFGTVLGNSFCESAKRAYANGVKPEPYMGRGMGAGAGSMDEQLIDGWQDVLTCKNAMVQAVGTDGFCNNLYWGRVAGMNQSIFQEIRTNYDMFMAGCNS